MSYKPPAREFVQGRDSYYNEIEIAENPFNKARKLPSWLLWRNGWLAAKRDDPLSPMDSLDEEVGDIELETGFESEVEADDE